MENTTIRFVEAAKNILQEYGYFIQHLWHVDDVHFLCEQRSWPKLDHEEARAVFLIFSELYDGELGMTWAKLEQATQVFLAQSGRLAHAHSHRSMSAESIEQQLIENED